MKGDRPRGGRGRVVGCGESRLGMFAGIGCQKRPVNSGGHGRRRLATYNPAPVLKCWAQVANGRHKRR